MDRHPPSRYLDKFMTRLPEGMRARVKELAARNYRSMNSEIIAALERHLAESAATGEGLGNSSPAAAHHHQQDRSAVSD